MYITCRLCPLFARNGYELSKSTGKTYEEFPCKKCSEYLIRDKSSALLESKG